MISQVKGRSKLRRRGAALIAPAQAREYAYRPTSDGWSPDEVKTAIESADSGNLQSLADLCETIMADDRVDGVCSTRTLGLLGLPLTFEGGTQEARDYYSGSKGVPGEWWKEHSESELLELHTWGLIMGVGLAQRVPLPRVMGDRQRYRLECWSPRWLTFKSEAVRGAPAWEVFAKGGHVPVIPGQGQWVLYTPFGAKRPWAKGKWRKIVFPWLLKRYALEDRANLGEVIGGPTMVGKTGSGSTERQRTKLLSQLVALGKRGKIVIPDGWDVSLLEATGRTWEIYSEAIAWADSAITIVLAGQVVTTEGSPGFSSGNVQERIVGSLIRFDAGALSTALHEQSIVPCTIAAGGKAVDAPYPVFDTAPPPDKEQTARTLEILGRAVDLLDKALSSDAQRIDVKTLLGALQIPLLAVAKTDAKPTEKIQLAPTDVARAVTLNEVRANNGLPPLLLPDGTPDPRGSKLMSELAAAADAAAVPVPNEIPSSLPS